MNVALRVVADLRKYREYFWIRVKTDLTKEFANSYLGYMWWVLDPLLYMGIYVFVVQMVMGRGGPQYPIFIFSALLLWRWLLGTFNYSLNSIITRKDILSHIYIPKFLFPLNKLVLNSIYFLFSIIILFIMLFIYRVPLTLHLLEFFPVFLVFFLFLFGVSLWLAHIGVMFMDADKISTYFLRFWYYLSPGLYDLDAVPGALRGLMWLNPLTTFFISSRNVFLYGRPPVYPGLAAWLLVSLVLIYTGLKKLYRNDKIYAKIF